MVQFGIGCHPPAFDDCQRFPVAPKARRVALEAERHDLVSSSFSSDTQSAASRRSASVIVVHCSSEFAAASTGLLQATTRVIGATSGRSRTSKMVGSIQSSVRQRRIHTGAGHGLDWDRGHGSRCASRSWRTSAVRQPWGRQGVCVSTRRRSSSDALHRRTLRRQARDRSRSTNVIDRRSGRFATSRSDSRAVRASIDPKVDECDDACSRFPLTSIAGARVAEEAGPLAGALVG